MKKAVLSKLVPAQTLALLSFLAYAVPAESQEMQYSGGSDEFAQLNNVLNNADAGRSWSAPQGNMGGGGMNGSQMGNMGGGMNGSQMGNMGGGMNGSPMGNMGGGMNGPQMGNMGGGMNGYMGGGMMNGSQMGNMGGGMMNGSQMGNMGGGMMNGSQMGNMGGGMMNGSQMGNMGGGMMNGSQMGNMGGGMMNGSQMGNMGGGMMNGSPMGNGFTPGPQTGNMGGMMGAPQMGGMMGAPAMNNSPFGNLAKLMGGQPNPLTGNVQSTGNKGIGSMLQQFMQGNANSPGTAVGASNPFNRMNLLKTFFGGAPGTAGSGSSSGNSAEQQAKNASVTGQAEALFQRATNQAAQAVSDAERASKGYGDKGSRLAAASSAQYHANDARAAADEAGNITYSGPQYAQDYAAQARAQANRAQEAADRAAYNAAQ